MNSNWGAHASAQKITKTTKSLKICCVFIINRIHFKIVRRRTEVMYQQRVSRSGLLIIERSLLLASRVKVHLLRSCWRKTF